MYVLLRKTEAGLKEISENHNIGSNKLEMAYVSGLGFGTMSGAFALINVLADSVSIFFFNYSFTDVSFGTLSSRADIAS